MNRARSYSESAVFMHSFDYTVPYSEYGGKNGAELCLELLGAPNAPFDRTGALRIPLIFANLIREPDSFGQYDSPKERSKLVENLLKRNQDLLSDSMASILEELSYLGGSGTLESSPYVPVLSDSELPRHLIAMFNENLIPQELASLPPQELLKQFQFTQLPRQETVDSPSEHQITFRVNKGRNLIEHATLQQIVRAFAEETQDMDAIQRLILAHEQFSDGPHVFSLFLDLFHEHETSHAPDMVIQARVLNVIKKWIELRWNYMKTIGLNIMLENFLTPLRSSNPKLAIILDKAIQQYEQTYSNSLVTLQPTKPKKPSKASKKGASLSLTDFDPADIAKQLTLIDFEFASKVELSELVRAQWIEEDGAPTLHAASKRVNDLAYWLAYQILTVKDMRKRVKVITSIIKVSKYLISLNSFNSLLAIYLAFNLGSTARLMLTWRQVSASHFQTWKKVSKIMSPMNNWKNYRSTLETLSPPMVLCQEVLLKDLLFEEEGKPDFISPGVVDMIKIDEIGALIDQYRLCQLKPYPIEKSQTLYDYLLNIPSYESAEDANQMLDELSATVEPSSLNFASVFPPGRSTVQTGGLIASNADNYTHHVRSLGSVPSWKRDLELSAARPQLSNPKPNHTGGKGTTTDDLSVGPISPRSAEFTSHSRIVIRTRQQESSNSDDEDTSSSS